MKRSEILVLCALVLAAAGFVASRILKDSSSALKAWGPCQDAVAASCLSEANSDDKTATIKCLVAKVETVSPSCQRALRANFPNYFPDTNIPKSASPEVARSGAEPKAGPRPQRFLRAGELKFSNEKVVCLARHFKSTSCATAPNKPRCAIAKNEFAGVHKNCLPVMGRLILSSAFKECVYPDPAAGACWQLGIVENVMSCIAKLDSQRRSPACKAHFHKLATLDKLLK